MLLLCTGDDDGGFSEFYFVTEPTDTIAVRGRPATLECRVHHDQGTAQIEWVRDEVSMTPDNRR